MTTRCPGEYFARWFEMRISFRRKRLSYDFYHDPKLGLDDFLDLQEYKREYFEKRCHGLVSSRAERDEINGENTSISEEWSEPYDFRIDDFRLHQAILGNRISEVLSTLGEREAGILELFYGLLECQPMNLRQIGRCYGICSERVRQIKTKALRKLRHPVRLGILEGTYKGKWKEALGVR